MFSNNAERISPLFVQQKAEIGIQTQKMLSQNLRGRKQSKVEMGRVRM
jgi:hypothetical protein